jgi:hypothetical protein
MWIYFVLEALDIGIATPRRAPKRKKKDGEG